MDCRQSKQSRTYRYIPVVGKRGSAGGGSLILPRNVSVCLYNKRQSQQPALGALTFLRSFVAGRANFCSHLLASLVHFTVVKSQAILSIPASWGHRSYFRRNSISSASFKTTKISTSLDMFRHNNFACGLCISIVALTATM